MYRAKAADKWLARHASNMMVKTALANSNSSTEATAAQAT